MARFPRLSLKASTHVARLVPGWARAASASTTVLAGLVLVMAVVLLGFVVPTPPGAADSQGGGPIAGSRGSAFFLGAGGGGLSVKGACSANMVESFVYDVAVTRADDVDVADIGGGRG